MAVPNLDLYSTQYKNYINLGDFTVKAENKAMMNFIKICNLRSLIWRIHHALILLLLIPLIVFKTRLLSRVVYQIS